MVTTSRRALLIGVPLTLTAAAIGPVLTSASAQAAINSSGNQRYGQQIRYGQAAPPPAWWSADSPINQPIRPSPAIDPNSAAMVANLAVGVHNLSSVSYAIGVYNASDAGTTRVNRTNVAAWAVGVPVNPRWVPPPGSDGSIVVIDEGRSRHWCLWRYDPAALTFGGGGWADPTGRVITTVEGTATGANFAFSAGLIRPEEVLAGRIDHALVFSTDVTDNGLATTGYGNPSRFRFPATRTDAQNLRGVASGRIPQGARVQLHPDVDLNAIPSGIQRTVARALQIYGAYCVDNGGIALSLYMQLTPFRWPSGGYDYETISSDIRQAGITTDYTGLERIPWNRMRVLASWNGA